MVTKKDISPYSWAAGFGAIAVVTAVTLLPLAMVCCGGGSDALVFLFLLPAQPFIQLVGLFDKDPGFVMLLICVAIGYWAVGFMAGMISREVRSILSRRQG